MNFVGHVHIARASETDPAFALGAMLPDFASMAGGRLGPSTEPRLAAGIAHHHRTDEAFHGAPDFVRLCTEVGAALEAQGVGWGGARAAAHVGVELLLDGVFLDDAATCALYLAATRASTAPDVQPHLRLGGGDPTRWEAVLRRVREQGIPHFYRDPDLVAERLLQIFAPRPRLAIDPVHRPVLARAMRDLQPRVRDAADALVRAAHLGHPVPEGGHPPAPPSGPGFR